MTLIEWGPGDSVKLVHQQQPNFIVRGKLQKRYFKNLIAQSSKIFTKKVAEQDEMISEVFSS